MIVYTGVISGLSTMKYNMVICGFILQGFGSFMNEMSGMMANVQAEVRYLLFAT
jgi:hypothetical protein